MHHDELGPLMRRRPAAAVRATRDGMPDRVQNLVAKVGPTAALVLGAQPHLTAITIHQHLSMQRA